MKNKVFCLGFQKTGTTSLTNFLERMDYNIAGYEPFRDLSDKEVTKEILVERAVAVMQEYDGAQDTPWYVLYPDMDAAFPGSKFIHVIRDTESWKKSALGDFSKHSNTIHEWIYGSKSPAGNEEKWAETYDRHNRDVQAYFAGREDDYLCLKLEDMALDADRIAQFLGFAGTVPDWPHSNKKAKKDMEKLMWSVQRKVRQIFGQS